MSQILNGKKLAVGVLKDLKKQIRKTKIKPGLAAVLVGHDPASHLYVTLKERACRQIGIRFEKYLLPEKTPEKRLISLIHFLNRKKDIHGLIVQLPLPQHINTPKIIKAIDPKKDVDGFHPINIRALKTNQAYVLPVMIQVILKFLRITHKNFNDKTACVICNSHTFLKPLQIILPSLGLKVIHSHPQDKKIKQKTRQADVLIVAIGKPKFITPDFVKKDAIVIDIGITKRGKKIFGDVDFNSVKDKVSFLTSVPGGVGPLTMAYLLKNTYQFSLLRND